MSVTAGARSFSYRDVARSGPPVDASPIAWEGAGETVAARYERSRPARLHRYDIAFTSTGGFAYETPLRTEAADDRDSARWLAGRYEYRRRWFSKVLPDWIDAGIGAQAIGGTLSMTRHAEPALESHEHDVWIGGAGVLSARLQRWRRLAIEATWANGIRIAHTSISRPAADGAAEGVGPGWLTDTAVRADVALTARASIVVEYAWTGEGLLSTHHGYAFSTGGIVAGVRYGR